MEDTLSSKKISFLTLVYLVLILTFPFRIGMYTTQCLLILVVTFAVLLYFFLKPQIAELVAIKDPQPILILTLISSITLSLIYYGGAYQKPGAIYQLSILLLAICFLLSITYFFKGEVKYRFVALFGLTILLRFLMIVSSPNPQIDVFVILKEAPQALMQGKNPYSISYTQSYPNVTPDYFSYWPGAFLLAIPFSVVFGEPRLLIILAETLSAILIYKLLQKRNSSPAEILTLISLFIPRAFFATGQGWIDPLIVTLLMVTACLEVKKVKNFFSPLLWGLSFTIKQTVFPIALFAYQAGVASIKKLTIALAVTAAIILPFFLWNPNNFINDTLGIFWRAGTTREALMHDSLTVNSWFFRTLGFDMPIVLRILIWTTFFVLILKKVGKGWANFFLACATWFLGFFIFSNQAFYNYYYFVVNLLLLAIVFNFYHEKIT